MRKEEHAWQREVRESEVYVDSIVQGTPDEAWTAIAPLLVASTEFRDHNPIIWELPSRRPVLSLPFHLVRRYRERYGIDAQKCFEANLCHADPVIAAYAIVGVCQDKGAMEGALRTLGAYPDRPEKLCIAGGCFMRNSTLSEYAAQNYSDLMELEQDWHKDLLQRRERRHWAALHRSAADYIDWFDEHMDGYLLCAEALFELRQFRKGMEVLEQVIGHSRSLPIQIDAAKVLLRQIGDYVASRNASNSDDGSREQSAAALTKRATSELARGNFISARQCLADAITWPGGDLGELHFLLADTYRCEGELSLAKQHYDLSLGFNPEHEGAKRHSEDVREALREEEEATLVSWENGGFSDKTD